MSDEIILLRHKDTLFFHYNVFFIKKTHFLRVRYSNKENRSSGQLSQLQKFFIHSHNIPVKSPLH